MANFVNENGIPLTEEELKEATGGWVISQGTGFFQKMSNRSCPDCGCIDFTIVSVSASGKEMYIKCKKCGRLCHEYE